MSDEISDMAGAAATRTGFAGVEIDGESIRVTLMHKGVRQGHTLGIEPTRNSIKHPAGLCSAMLHALKTESPPKNWSVSGRACKTWRKISLICPKTCCIDHSDCFS